MVSLQPADLSYKRTLGNRETGSKRSVQPFLLNWNIIALQSCGHFCCTALWISHMYTYIPSLPPLPPHPTPLGHHRALGWALCVILDRVKLYFGGLQNHCRWWLQPWNKKMLAPWKESYVQPRQHIKKQSNCFANKGLSSQGYGFSSGHV